VRKGTLVRVHWGGHHSREPADSALGEVLDYHPDVLGGSSSQCWRDQDGAVHNEIVQVPKRGQVLVLLYEDGGMAWWDEINIERIEEE
jgi:hypothetical protein